ncbi:MAG: hypothetical protein R2839_02315 [Thermomicrobiales bacterium]
MNGSFCHRVCKPFAGTANPGRQDEAVDQVIRERLDRLQRRWDDTLEQAERAKSALIQANLRLVVGGEKAR